MDHEEAARSQAVDHYLLGRFSTPERDEFEEHLFECPICAEEVRLGAILEANARAVFQEEAEGAQASEPQDEPSRGASILGWLFPRFDGPSFQFQGPTVQMTRPAFGLASLALALLLGWSGMLTLGLLTPGNSIQPTVSELLKVNRTGGETLVFPSGIDHILLRVRLEDTSYPYYLLEFSGPAGRVVREVANQAQWRAEGELHVLMARASFPEGDWTLALSGLVESQSSSPVRIGDVKTFRIEKQGGKVR